MHMIEARDITKRYGTIQALDGIDVTVGPGEIVGFLGPNGAGKTTAISVMLGLRKPTSGATRLFGLAPDDRRARERTGVMLQESGVPFSLRVEEVLRTNIPIDQARRLPGVQHIAAEKQHLVVSTSEPEAFLRELFCADWQVADLTVQGADLETAFRALTEEVTT